MYLYRVYELNNWLRNTADNFTLENCLFGTIKIIINADKNKFTYNGQGIRFDGKGMWYVVMILLENVVIFGADNALSSHIDNKKKLVLGEGLTEGINNSVPVAKKI